MSVLENSLPLELRPHQSACWQALPPFNIVKLWPPTEASLLPRPSKPVVRWPPPLPGLCLQLGRAEGDGRLRVAQWFSSGRTVAVGEGRGFCPKRPLATSGDVFNGDVFNRGMCSWHPVGASQGCWAPQRTGESPTILLSQDLSCMCWRNPGIAPQLSEGFGWWVEDET